MPHNVFYVHMLKKKRFNKKKQKKKQLWYHVNVSTRCGLSIPLSAALLPISLSVLNSMIYFRYGTDVEQLIVLNLAQHTPLSIFIDVTLILSVMFTYPLQTFPVLEIAEAYIFTSGRYTWPDVCILKYILHYIFISGKYILQ